MKKKKKRKDTGTGIMGTLKEETRHFMLSILFFVGAIFFALASLGKAGIAGTNFYRWFEFAFGVGYFLIPICLAMLGVLFLRNTRPNIALPAIVGATLFFVSGLGIIDLLAGKNAGGITGEKIAAPLVFLFDFWISVILLAALFIISFSIIFDWKPAFSIPSFFKRSPKNKSDNVDNSIKGTNDDDGDDDDDDDDAQEEAETEEENEEPEEVVPKAKKAKSRKTATEAVLDGEGDDLSRMYATQSEYTPPPLSLLAGDKGKPGVGDTKANSNIIKRTLQSFGILVEMDDVEIGPSITRYSLKPAEGVKLSRIVGLQNDLALSLAAHPIRIEAPIPGKSLVGIEIPNSTKTTVGLGTLLSTEEYKKSARPLLLSLGRGISGKSHFADLAKMPHLLIAGTTGSGKSVAIHTIITSLLYRNHPANLRFIMIDPKRVELTAYNKIPHLQTPVITDAGKAIKALKWAANEMNRRYDILEAEKVRDIESYHKNILIPALEGNTHANEEDSDLPESMPYIAIVIDELADIMTSYPREMESAIVRLAQMSRAVGIHLILSTQRPSVNIITGLIKANIPSRIALQVASQIDSRTILDTGGAEKLLGSGDMLYMSGEMSKPVRLQSAFISENEVKKVVSYLVGKFGDTIPEDITLASPNSEKNALFESLDDNSANDDLYEEAREVVIKAQKASASYLQRKLRVGYARAARLLDILEERAVIGPGEGSKPRDVLIKDKEGYGIEETENETAETNA